MNLEALLKTAKESAEALSADFKDADDDWPPVAFFSKTHGVVGIGDLTCETEHERQVLLDEELPGQIKEIGATEVVLALSSWSSERSDETTGNDVGEELLIIAISLIEVKAESAPIIREIIPGSTPRLGAWAPLQQIESPWIDSVRSGLAKVAR